MQRRRFLQTAFYGAASTFLWNAYGCGQAQNENAQFNLISGCDDQQGNHFVSAFSHKGEQGFQIPVPQRVHDSCASVKHAKVFFFARRPGTEVYVIDTVSGKLQQTIYAHPDRHFYGHGFVSDDQRYLFLTENDFQHGQGVIGVYELGETITKVSEMSSFGIGPHQISLLSDKKTAVVANGGLLTHPDKGRDVLNLDTMQSNLSYVDIHSGKLLEQQLPPYSLMSIRHLSVSKQDQVVVGVQYQGEKSDLIPLVGVHRRGDSIQWLACPEQVLLQLNQYTASVSVNAQGSHALISCPRGNRVTLWNLQQRRFVDYAPIKDVAGLVALESGEWIATSGYGEVLTVQWKQNKLSASIISKLPVRWDNHATLI